MIRRIFTSLLLSLLLASPSWATIAANGASVATGGTTSIVLNLPASITAGDLLTICVANKYPTNGPSLPTGGSGAGVWIAPANNQGTGDPGDGPGAGVGATYATMFYKIADGTESGTVTILIASGNVGWAIINLWTDGTNNWDVVTVNGGDSTSGTAWSATMGADPGILTDDLVHTCSAMNANTTASSNAITTTGITYGTTTEQTDSGTTTGDDVALVTSRTPVTSGTSSAAPVVTFTAAAATAGGTVIMRLREVAAAGAAVQSGQGFLGAIIK